MLIPRYSIRRLLLLTTTAAVVSLLFRAAALGQVWAQAIVIGAAFFLFSFLVFGILFALLWTYSLVFHARRSRNAKRVSAPMAELAAEPVKEVS